MVSKFAFIIIVIFIISFTSISYSQTQLELSKSACNTYKETDFQLNTIYNQILAEHKDDQKFIQKFKEAQRAWIKFRDAYAESLYPNNNPENEYGSVYSMCFCQTLADITTDRIKQLNQWAQGINEGEVCIGSRKVKN